MRKPWIVVLCLGLNLNPAFSDSKEILGHRIILESKLAGSAAGTALAVGGVALGDGARIAKAAYFKHRLRRASEIEFKVRDVLESIDLELKLCPMDPQETGQLNMERNMAQNSLHKIARHKLRLEALSSGKNLLVRRLPLRLITASLMGAGGAASAALLAGQDKGSQIVFGGIGAGVTSAVILAMAHTADIRNPTIPFSNWGIFFLGVAAAMLLPAK